jgi:hypothetical protein
VFGATANPPANPVGGGGGGAFNFGAAQTPQKNFNFGAAAQTPAAQGASPFPFGTPAGGGGGGGFDFSASAGGTPNAFNFGKCRFGHTVKIRLG